jgi:drug/metabolite transporter (DMT)-like permease
MRGERASLGADAALLAVTAVWGLTFTAVQRALEAAGPFSFLAARFALGAGVLLLVFPRRVLRISRSTLLVSVLLGGWLAAGYGLQTIGLVYTTASKSAFITGLCVILVPIFSLALSRVRPRWSSLAAVVLAASGLYLLTAPGSLGLNLGDLLTLGCAFAFAVHIVIAERVAPRHDAAPLAFWQIVTTAVISTALMGTVEGPRLPLNRWTVSALGITGVLATAVAFAVQMWAQRRTSATHVAVIFTAEPVFAALFSWLIQHELLGASGLVGGGLIITGILVAQVGARPRSAGREGAEVEGGSVAREEAFSEGPAGPGGEP